MSKTKSLNQNAGHARGRLSTDEDSGVEHQRKAERSARTVNDRDSKGRKEFLYHSDGSPVRSSHAALRTAKRGADKRPASTEPASTSAFFKRGAHMLEERDWADASIVFDQRESFPAKGTAIEQAILRAKDLTILRLEDEVDSLKRQAARAQQLSSTKLREQEEKIRELKRQVLKRIASLEQVPASSPQFRKILHGCHSRLTRNPGGRCGR